MQHALYETTTPMFRLQWFTSSFEVLDHQRQLVSLLTSKACHFREVKYPGWLSNLVYRDLNKVDFGDNYPLQ